MTPLVDSFPAEAIPDGAILAPHHLYAGFIVTILGVLVAAFAFVTMWRWYPVAGATGTILGVLIAQLGVLISLDDAISHAFGVTTPLDWTWANYIHPYMV